MAELNWSWKEIEADIGARLRLTFVDNTDAVGNLEELLWSSKTTVPFMQTQIITKCTALVNLCCLIS